MFTLPDAGHATVIMPHDDDDDGHNDHNDHDIHLLRPYAGHATDDDDDDDGHNDHNDHAVHLLRPYTGHATDAIAEAKLSLVLAVIV